MNRGRLVASVVGALLGLLPAALPAAGLSVDPATAELRPSQLVGLWWAGGEDVGQKAALRLESVYLDVEDSACSGRGMWKARPSGLFVAGLYPDERCPDPPSWLLDAVAFRVAGSGRELLDRGGRVLATLRRAQAEPYGPWARRPVDELSPGHRSRFDRAPAPAPLGVLPATRELLVGRWMPAVGAERSPHRTYVSVRGDGRWRGWELCSGRAGRWALGTDGGLAATDEGVNAPLCRDVPPVTQWMVTAARAGFFGTELVLTDADGKELGRLVRDRRGEK